jgi:endonuclease/exonuclease/phosphatase family metal-dependent hydrolase
VWLPAIVLGLVATGGPAPPAARAEISTAESPQATHAALGWGSGAVRILGYLVLGSLAVTLGTRGPAQRSLSVRSRVAPAHRADLRGTASPLQHLDTLRVMTLNLAHGRSDGRHQLLQRPASIRRNLAAVSAVLQRERPHVVALQEADGPSFWSGGFDHVDFLMHDAHFAEAVRGEHVRGPRVRYGTAVLSQLPLGAPLSVTFAPSPPTLSKGFVLATLAWPGQPDLQIDVVSVHLDFLRPSVRRSQVRELVHWLAGRQRPRIIMGDFNCTFRHTDSPLAYLARALDLHAFRPQADDLETFPQRGERLDWILASHQLQFQSYETLDDAVSDHRAVVAEIRWVG